MADGAAAATSEFAKAAVSVGGFTKNLQSGALYVKMYNKAFGPFFDLFVKTKQVMQTTAEVMEDLSGGFEEMEEAVEPVAGIIGILGKGLKGVVMTMVMGIGIALALMMGLMLLGGGMGGLGDLLPGIGDSLGRIFDGFLNIGTQIMSLVGIIFSMDFTPIIEPLIAFGVGALALLIHQSIAFFTTCWYLPG